MSTSNISTPRNWTEKAKPDATTIPFLYLLCYMTSTKSLSACFCLCVCSIASFLAWSVVSAISRGQCELQHCLFKLTSNGLVSLLDCCGSSRQTPRFHFLIASRGGVAGAGGMYQKPVQKGVSSTWGCCVMGKRSLCSREHGGAWLGNFTWWCRSWACGFGFASDVAKKAAEKKNLQIFSGKPLSVSL